MSDHLDLIKRLLRK